MGWLTRLRRRPRWPADATLVAAEGRDLQAATPWLELLADRLGPVLRARLDPGEEGTAELNLVGSERAVRRRLQAIAPARLVIVGRAAERFDLPDLAGCPSAWINARHAQVTGAGCDLITTATAEVAAGITGSEPLGDPLPGLTAAALPGAPDGAICERLEAHRRAERWIGYFAETGEGEEAIAYNCFFRLVRHGMGLMVLGPADPARAEPVYRDAIRYRLPTNRHKRLSTSHADIKTRVYFLEEPAALKAMYACPDFAVIGGTLSPEATNPPDLLTPAVAGCPMIVGPAHRTRPLVHSALDAGAALGASNEEQIVAQARRLLDKERERDAVITLARDWAERLPDAARRVLERIQAMV